MLLSYCTITGADDAVDPARLEAISHQYPFVEWAILCSPDHAGKPRYPRAEWVKGFHAACPDVHKATHLCYSALTGFINGDEAILSHVAAFPRIQLNISPDSDVATIDPVALMRQVARQPDKQFILQYNERTRHLLIEGAPSNLAVLLDASAGTGVRPDSWPPPLPGRLCGYAGGIGPDNIGETLDSLSGIVPTGSRTWIDMESRARTNDQLDLNKVLAVLEIMKLNARQLDTSEKNQFILGLT